MMSDKEAFLAGIIDNPNGTHRRLIYADFLEENGEPERAEFIRCQCRAQKITLDTATLKRILPGYLKPSVKYTTFEGFTFGYVEEKIMDYKLADSRVYGMGFLLSISDNWSWLLGGSCYTCNGYGHHARNDSLDPEEVRRMAPSMVCKDCDGKKSVPGILKAAARENPIELVTVSDFDPANATTGSVHEGCAVYSRSAFSVNTFAWFAGKLQAMIPDEVFSRLQNPLMFRHENGVWEARFRDYYETREDISQAILEVARS